MPTNRNMLHMIIAPNQISTKTLDYIGFFIFFFYFYFKIVHGARGGRAATPAHLGWSASHPWAEVAAPVRPPPTPCKIFKIK
jgi:hypothetical protein